MNAIMTDCLENTRGSRKNNDCKKIRHSLAKTLQHIQGYANVLRWLYGVIPSAVK